MCLQGRRCPWRLGSMPVHPVQRVQGLSEMNPRTLRFHIPGGSAIAVRFTPRDATRRTCSLGCPESARLSALTRRWPRRPMPHRPEFRTSPGPPSRWCGSQYTPGWGAVSSGRRYPPFLMASALGERGFWKSYAAVLYPFYPTLRVSSRPDPGSAQRYPGEEPGPTLRHRQGEKWVPVCGDCERVVAGGRPLGPRLIRPLSG